MKKIALALSGGGFRAAAYSLGTLSYLNELKIEDGNKCLLENVKFVGSTSGGSMANIIYSRGVFRGDAFSKTYHSLLAAMDGEKLIARVFKILKLEKAWQGRGTKSRNLINAFSIAYDETFGNASFNELFTPADGVRPHLEEVCINATEFTNGISFRFQSQQQGVSNGLVGNYYIYFSNLQTAGDILLGDIMACSSCFSGGFEPFIFPDDFVHSKLSREQLIAGIVYDSNPYTITDTKAELLPNTDFKAISQRFGLMDGGVADNQAVDSIFKSNDRRQKSGKGFDLVILTDVDGYFVDGYTLPMEKQRWYSSFTLQQVINTFKITGVAALAILGWILVKGWQEWMKFLIVPAVTLGLAYGAGAIYLIIIRKNSVRDRSTWLIIFFNYISYFLTIRFSQVRQMITSRLKSVFMLADDLYLKQIRRMYYNKIYSDQQLGPITVSNAIYDLSKAKQQSLKDERLQNTVDQAELSAEQPAGMALPSAEIVAIAEQARTMPTTLWFDPFQDQAATLRAIVAAGQFTTCYSLLKYYTEKKTLSQEETTLKESLQNDWQAFNKDPFHLYNQLAKQK